MREPEVVHFYKHFSPYKVSIDIGASEGHHTRELAKISDLVIAIEPVNEVEDVPYNVVVIRLAVGDSMEKRNIYWDPTASYGCGTNAYLKKGKHKQEKSKEVQVVTLDSIVQEGDFLKCDVEGWEVKILKNAKLRNNFKYGMIETHGTDKEIFEMFRNDYLIYDSEGEKVKNGEPSSRYFLIKKNLKIDLDDLTEVVL